MIENSPMIDVYFFKIDNLIKGLDQKADDMKNKAQDF